MPLVNKFINLLDPPKSRPSGRTKQTMSYSIHHTLIKVTKPLTNTYFSDLEIITITVFKGDFDKIETEDFTELRVSSFLLKSITRSYRYCLWVELSFLCLTLPGSPAV